MLFAVSPPQELTKLLLKTRMSLNPTVPARLSNNVFARLSWLYHQGLMSAAPSLLKGRLERLPNLLTGLCTSPPIKTSNLQHAMLLPSYHLLAPWVMARDAANLVASCIIGMAVLLELAATFATFALRARSSASDKRSANLSGQHNAIQPLQTQACLCPALLQAMAQSRHQSIMLLQSVAL